MIINPTLVTDTTAFKYFIAENNIGFFDFGCSSGGGTKWTQNVLNQIGLGFDIDPTKIELAHEAGLMCCQYDLLTLPNEKLTEQTIIFHMLEHLYSVKQATEFIHKAVQVSRERVTIKQPYYDTDPQLFRLGLKTFYSHWTGHRNQMTTPDFWFILDELRRKKLIKEFSIGYKKPIKSSSSPILHPLESPINCHEYDPATHPPKPMDIEIEFPLYYEIQIEIDISGNGHGDIWNRLSPEEIVYDSRMGLASAAPGKSMLSHLNRSNLIYQRSQQIEDGIYFFIRDDDFVKISEKFTQLETIARSHGEFMLAAIPAGLEVSQDDCSRILKNFSVVQHGYRHIDHSGTSEKNEFPASRAMDLVEKDLMAGKAILQNMFGADAGRHFVAPWNRFSPQHLDLLEKLGYISYQGLGSILFHNNLPLVGYCINFTSIFEQCESSYPRMLDLCKKNITAYVTMMTKAVEGQQFFIPINTHHLMMCDTQFFYLDRLCVDLQKEMGLQFAHASQVLAGFSTLKERVYENNRLRTAIGGDGFLS